MINHQRRAYLERKILSKVQMPAQYIGGERNIVVKDHRRVRGKVCLGFPDAYTIGMSHHGLQVLYSLMNRREDWAAERVFCPWPDMEQQLRANQLPLFSLETFTALSEFDVLGLSLQYEISSPNVLTMLDLGDITLHSRERTLAEPLVLAGGPCCQNPEPMADFFDVMVIGDGEPALPEVCDLWLELRDGIRDRDGGLAVGEAGRRQREEALATIAGRLAYAYVPRFYQPEYRDDRVVAMHRTREDVPETIAPSTIGDRDALADRAAGAAG
jgi:radical SAM superfamily enzyme YgiQ (UPF0313 family)